MTDRATAARTDPHSAVSIDADLPAGAPLIKPGYDDRLANDDLAPLAKQRWSSYNIFAFWMSDVHSVGGYVTAGSLFALGLAGWQVLVALVVGIVIVQIFCNLVAKPSQVTGVPYPVINRAIFGIRGANIPGIIRGLIAIAWYGVQTYLAAQSLNIVFLKFFPDLASWNTPRPPSSGSRRSATSPTRSSGSPRPPCSGAGWSRSAASSTGPAPRSTS